MEDYYSNDVATAAHLAADHELPAEPPVGAPSRAEARAEWEEYVRRVRADPASVDR